MRGSSHLSFSTFENSIKNSGLSNRIECHKILTTINVGLGTYNGYFLFEVVDTQVVSSERLTIHRQVASCTQQLSYAESIPPAYSTSLL